MPQTKTSPKNGKRAVQSQAKSAPAGENGEVLTLVEAAAYLRVKEEDLVRLIGPDGIPGRMIGTEWRFLKTALQTWLSTPPKASSKEALLSMEGAFKDDPDLGEIVETAYRQRGRPITEAGSFQNFSH